MPRPPRPYPTFTPTFTRPLSPLPRPTLPLSLKAPPSPTRRRPRPNLHACTLSPTPPDPPPPQLGLLTDSVLETKWKNEATHPGPSPAPPPPLVCSPSPDDITASDPYQAFAAFTRIAAPTAALGHPEPLPRATGGLDHEHGADDGAISDSPFSVQLSHDLRRTDLPYSAASIAYRLMRYSYAKKNLADFAAFFQGEFDNYHQVAAERGAGMGPCDGGGHEHIHCSVRMLAPGIMFARYYFNGDPRLVFRSRVYKVMASDLSERGLVEMRIFRFYEETERRLKACQYDVDVIQWEEADVYDWLEGCEVFWERYDPPAGGDEASERLGIEPGTRFVGYMKGGGCELYSRELGGRIRVMDDLLLTAEDLWVADRGFDERNQFVYGNRRGVPYKMKRVHRGGELDWTLSEDEPPPEGYMP